MLTSLCDRGAMAAAGEFFVDAMLRGLTPNIDLYNTLLQGHSRFGSVEEFSAVFNELLDSRVKPTCFTLTILVRFYGRHKMIANVLEAVRTIPKRFKFKIDSYLYTELICACAWSSKHVDLRTFLVEVSVAVVEYHVADAA